MATPSRREESKHSEINVYLRNLHKKKVDLTENVHNGFVLEGTGSMVLDRANRYSNVLYV